MDVLTEKEAVSRHFKEETNAVHAVRMRFPELSSSTVMIPLPQSLRGCYRWLCVPITSPPTESLLMLSVSSRNPPCLSSVTITLLS